MAADARPAQPKAILRGHKAQVHAAVFVRGNDRLLTGDADGFVVAWDLTTMRPRAVWQAHGNAILGIAAWDHYRIITHGRDNKLIVWKLAPEDEARLSTKLPLDPSSETRPQPWMLYMLEVNTMNFCSFSHCPACPESSPASSEILVAVPNTLASEAIDIFHLPTQTRQHTVKLGEKNGMVMALSLFHQAGTLTLVAGYENGVATVAQLGSHGVWVIKYQAKCHSQPILSLDVSPPKNFFLTSSADAVISKHPLPLVSPPSRSSQISQSPTSPSIYNPSPPEADPQKSLLTAALSRVTTSPSSPPVPLTPNSAETIQHQPLKTVNTKHAGQQSLRIRFDGRIFATAGWDSKVRVYSAKTLNEVAVLKWHIAGCYAAAFAAVDVDSESESTPQQEQQQQQEENEQEEKSRVEAEKGGAQDGGDEEARKDVTVVPKLVEMSVREKRIRQARTTHWLAAGSKDGKVSLWDVF
ncbi:WD40 repeat-like protein [Parathielavia appendiculata]|uniref:ASTRA-associated protein 1 n=1 Tax=Parathielavia appendiculata TaxID=2587402 RepID=A0AAN6TVS2_9PEZI|nr:WD40 repeat-like protein [Parathielavia appendiculata]